MNSASGPMPEEIVLVRAPAGAFTLTWYGPSPDDASRREVRQEDHIFPSPGDSDLHDTLAAWGLTVPEVRILLTEGKLLMGEDRSTPLSSRPVPDGPTAPRSRKVGGRRR